MGLADNFLWSAHPFAGSCPNFYYEMFWRSGTPAAKQEEHLQTAVFFHFFPILPLFSLFLSNGCSCAFPFIFHCHVILFVSKMLPWLTFRLPSSSCIPSNCRSMPWGFPSPICLKSLARCYLPCITSIAKKCDRIFIVLFKEKKTKAWLLLHLVPHVWACCSAALFIRIDCRYFCLIDSPSQFEILLGEWG